MSKSAKRLGRGLDSLVPNLREASPVDAYVAQDRAGPIEQAPQAESGVTLALSIPIERLKPNPHQPRDMKYTGDIVSLTDSIRRSGVLQPIIARRAGEACEIVAGERRWRAAQAAGLKEVPVVLKEASDEQMLEWALVENIQREDLNAIDRAKAYRRFCDRFQLRPEEVAERVGEDRTTVVNYLRLLELPENIQALVVEGHLSMGHARSLSGVQDNVIRSQLARAVVENQLSVRALEELIRRGRSRETTRDSAPSASKRSLSPHVRQLQSLFEQALKTKVSIREGRRRGAGRIVIEYYSLDDFDRIASRLGVALDEAMG